MIPTEFPFTLLLASGSPRRRDLIGKMNIPFEITKVEVEEVYPADLSPQEVVVFLSALKSEAYGKVPEGKLLVTSDTLVSLNGRIIEKAASADEAKQMLRDLSGNSHQVFSGVTLRSQNRQKSFFDTTNVYFRELEESEIAYYVDAFEPFDKAGSYGVQEWIGMVGVEKMEGDFYNVMGLPVFRLYQELKQWMNETP